MAATRITFLMGAGSAVDAGLPSAWELTNRLAALSRHLPDSNAAHIENLFRTLQARLGHEKGVAASEIDFEEVVGVLFEIASGQLAAAQSLFGRADGILGDWLDAKALPDAAERVFALIRRTLDVAPSETTYLDKLVNLVPRARLDFFTLNYDLSLEAMLERSRLDFVDGFSFRRTSRPGVVRWSPGVYEKPRVRARLFKLHGSVDWAFLRPSTDPINWGQAQHEEYLRKLPTLVRLERWQDYRLELPGSSLGLVSAINLGTHKELLYSAPAFAEMFYRFRESLSTNDLCVVIGYSFRDERINEVLEEVVTARRGALRLMVVDPAAMNLLEQWPILGQFTGARVASVLDATARQALESGDLKAQVRLLFRESVRKEAAAWATESYSYAPADTLGEARTAAMAVRGELDGLLTLQAATWRRLGWTDQPPHDGPDVEDAIASLGRRSTALAIKLNRLRTDHDLDVPAPPHVGAPQRARAFQLLEDFPGYLTRTHVVFHDPSVRNTARDRLFHLANSVAAAFDDAAFILRDAARHLGIVL